MRYIEEYIQILYNYKDRKNVRIGRKKGKYAWGKDTEDVVYVTEYNNYCCVTNV